MTNCEDCVYYEYDPEADTNYCEAAFLWRLGRRERWHMLFVW